MADCAWTPGCKLGFLGLGFRDNSVSGARHGGRQPRWRKPGLNSGDPLVGCQQSEASLLTDRVWIPGGKLGFLELGSGILGLTLSQVLGTDRGNPANGKLA